VTVGCRAAGRGGVPLPIQPEAATANTQPIRPTPTYAQSMLWIILLIVVAAVLAYRFRVPLLAKLLGQSEDRVRRQLNRRKD
jgi:hypothetical protein